MHGVSWRSTLTRTVWAHPADCGGQHGTTPSRFPGQQSGGRQPSLRRPPATTTTVASRWRCDGAIEPPRTVPFSGTGGTTGCRVDPHPRRNGRWSAPTQIGQCRAPCHRRHHHHPAHLQRRRRDRRLRTGGQAARRPARPPRPRRPRRRPAAERLPPPAGRHPLLRLRPDPAVGRAAARSDSTHHRAVRRHVRVAQR